MGVLVENRNEQRDGAKMETLSLKNLPPSSTFEALVFHCMFLKHL